MRNLTAPLSDHFGHHDAVRVAGVLKALSHPNRLRLLNLLRLGERPAGEVMEALKPLTQPTASHHLKVLLDAGLVSRRWERKGSVPRSYYSLVPGALADVAEVLAQGADR